jgi:hypothetical protein
MMEHAKDLYYTYMTNKKRRDDLEEEEDWFKDIIDEIEAAMMDIVGEKDHSFFHVFDNDIEIGENEHNGFYHSNTWRN